MTVAALMQFMEAVLALLEHRLVNLWGTVQIT